MTKDDQHNLRGELKRCGVAHRRAHAAAARADEQRAELVRQALQAGIPGVEVARLLGVTRQRVDQLHRASGRAKRGPEEDA